MTQFYQALETAFGDPNRTATAQRFIQNLKQANQPFAQYLTDFEANIYNTKYDEANQRFAFKEGLSYELKQNLIPTRAHDISFTEFKSLYQRMDNEQRQIKPFIPRARAILETTQSSNAIAPYAFPHISTPAINRSTNDSNTAIDLSQVNQAARPRGPLAPEVRQYRINNKLCLYAGCTGHQAKDYPLRKLAEERKTSLRSTTFGTPAPAEALQITAPPVPVTGSQSDNSGKA